MSQYTLPTAFPLFVFVFVETAQTGRCQPEPFRLHWLPQASLAMDGTFTSFPYFTSLLSLVYHTSFARPFEMPPRHSSPSAPWHIPENIRSLSLAFRPREESKLTSNRPFIPQFISSRGNEYFCEIDEEYLTDRFNLTGLNTEVQYYQYALDLITDVFDLDADDDLREQIEKSARHLYGLVHARYIVTTRGLAKMVCIWLLCLCLLGLSCLLTISF
jgi:hypothetical protein